jgi:hypothetical protein
MNASADGHAWHWAFDALFLPSLRLWVQFLLQLFTQTMSLRPLIPYCVQAPSYYSSMIHGTLVDNKTSWDSAHFAGDPSTVQSWTNAGTSMIADGIQRPIPEEDHKHLRHNILPRLSKICLTGSTLGLNKLEEGRDYIVSTTSIHQKGKSHTALC